jgi:hypothetical protein
MVFTINEGDYDGLGKLLWIKIKYMHLKTLMAVNTSGRVTPVKFIKTCVSQMEVAQVQVQW